MTKLRYAGWWLAAWAWYVTLLPTAYLLVWTRPLGVRYSSRSLRPYIPGRKGRRTRTQRLWLWWHRELSQPVGDQLLVLARLRDDAWWDCR